MEDPECDVFRGEGESEPVFAKRVLPETAARRLHAALSRLAADEAAGSSRSNLPGGLASGLRERLDLTVRDLDGLTSGPDSDFVFSQHLGAVLRGYGVGLLPGGDGADAPARFYRQHFGGIREHRDGPTPHGSRTLLLYLSDGFEGGELQVKIPRTEADLARNGHPELRHKRFTFAPTVGAGVVFCKSSLHWAEEVFADAETKDVLLLDLQELN